MKREKGLKWMIVALLGIALISGAMIVSYLYTLGRETKRFEALHQSVDRFNSSSQEGEEDSRFRDMDEMRTSGLIKLKEENHDLVGWVTVSGTKIDYPVMYTPENPEYYLHHDFDRKASRSGVPFIDGKCSPDRSDNIIIYGHHMKNGTMFSDLLLYSEKSFWEQNPMITFYTTGGKRQYEIIAAFPVDVTDENALRCYEFTDASSAEEFDEFLDSIKKSSLYETGGSASYGDALITLSTCSYHVDDGRFVIVGKAVD